MSAPKKLYPCKCGKDLGIVRNYSPLSAAREFARRKGIPAGRVILVGNHGQNRWFKYHWNGSLATPRGRA